MQRALWSRAMWLGLVLASGCLESAEAPEPGVVLEEAIASPRQATSAKPEMASADAPASCAVAALTGKPPPGASEEEIAVCLCFNGRLCGGTWLPPMTCGTMVCGYDRRWYTCSGGTWWAGGSCSC